MKRNPELRLEAEHSTAAQEAVWALEAAACAGAGEQWNAGEAGVQRARSLDGMLQAADPLMAVCGHCPVRAACAAWAAADSYSGIAAGQLWIDGVPVQELGVLAAA